MTVDPTYNRAVIAANPTWQLAFVMSEIDNDRAPLGWGRYIMLAEGLQLLYDLHPKAVPGDRPEEGA